MNFKNIFLGLTGVLFVSVAHADRLGSLKSDADVLLTTQAVAGSGIVSLSKTTPGATNYIFNQTTLQSGTTLYVTSGTISNLNVTNINGASYPPAGGSGTTIYNATATAGFPFGADFSTWSVTQVNDSIGDPSVTEFLTTPNAVFVNQTGAIFHSKLPATSVQSYFEMSASTYSYFDNPTSGSKLQLYGNNNSSPSTLFFVLDGTQVLYSEPTFMQHNVPVRYTNAIGNYVAFRSSSADVTDYTVVHPAAPGTAGQVRQIANVDGTTVYEEYATASGGSGLVSLSTNTPGATNYIFNQRVLQAGATAYPSFLKVGSSATVSGAMVIRGGTLNLEPAATAINITGDFNPSEIGSVLQAQNSRGSNPISRISMGFDNTGFGGYIDFNGNYMRLTPTTNQSSTNGPNLWLGTDADGSTPLNGMTLSNPLTTDSGVFFNFSGQSDGGTIAWSSLADKFITHSTWTSDAGITVSSGAALSITDANDDRSWIFRATTTMTGDVEMVGPPSTGTVAIGQVLKVTNVSRSKVFLDFAADASGGGGSGSPLEVFSNISVVTSSPTLSIGVGGGLIASVSGSTASFKIDFSSAISRSDVVAAYQPLDATLTDLAAAPLGEDNSIAVAAVAAGTLPTDVMASSITLPAFFSDANVRTNLGLAIGTNVQAYDADLDDLADGSLTGSKVGSGVPAANIAAGSLGTTVIASSVSLPGFFSDANVRSNLGLAIGTNVQAYDADLDDLADGSLTGSKVGSGVPAANIAAGALGSSVLVSSHQASGVTAGSYTNTNLTVDAQGRVTAASNGTAGSGGVSSFTYTFRAETMHIVGSSQPYISFSTGEAAGAVYFDETSTQAVTMATTLSNYNGGALYADVIFTSTATSGTVNWGVYVECKTPNTSAENYDTEAFDVLNSSSVTLSGTSGAAKKATVTLTNKDSCANGDAIRLKLTREAGVSDTAVGFGKVRFLRLFE